MFCPNCGTENPDSGRFCKNCGTPLQAPVMNQPQTPPPVQPAAPMTPEVKKQPKAPKEKKGGKKIIIAIVAAIVILIGGVVLVSQILKAKKDISPYVYLSDGKLMLLTEPDAEPIKLDSNASRKAPVTFSEDGKYIYYFSDFSAYNDSGELYRAEYKKLKAGSDKNSKYITKIDSNAYEYFRELADSKLLYFKYDPDARDDSSSFSAYIFNGEDTLKVKDIPPYATYTSCDSENVYFMDDNNSLKGFKAGNPGDIQTIKTDVTSAYVAMTEDGNIVFGKEAKKENFFNGYDLYAGGIDKEAELIAENIKSLMWLDEGFAFLEASGETVPLYSFIKDDKADADSKTKEPDRSDYEVPYYNYYTINSDYYDETDFDELYTSCTKSLYWYGIYSSYSMEESLNYDWHGDNSDAVHKATKAFINKYAGKADSDGCIKVTSEVKADLKKIAKAAGDESRWTWLSLCLERSYAGVHFDSDSYYDDMEAYEAADARNQVRKELKDNANAIPVQNLYTYKKGEKKVLAENIVLNSRENDCLLYNTKESVKPIISIDDIESANYFKTITIDYSTETYFYNMKEEKGYKISGEAATSLTKLMGKESYEKYTDVLFNDGYCLIFTDSSVYKSKCSENEISEKFEKLDNVESLSSLSEDAIYLRSEYKDGKTDYYLFENGEVKLVAPDLISFVPLKDGTAAGITRYNSNNNSSEITLFNNGKGTLLADDVTSIINTDGGNLLYISDGDLYYRKNGESEKIRKDVDIIWDKTTVYYYD